MEDARFEADSLGCAVQSRAADQARVMGRPRLLGRAVENVIRNGLKYSPKGGMVEVEVSRRDTCAVIAVRDQGPGVPETELENMFEPFKRGAHGTGGGFGLGLAIAKGAVDMHAGTITARNRPEGGLCVTISLPGHPA
jgi:two-component system OmpR family sensor kinase